MSRREQRMIWSYAVSAVAESGRDLFLDYQAKGADARTILQPWPGPAAVAIVAKKLTKRPTEAGSREVHSTDLGIGYNVRRRTF